MDSVEGSQCMVYPCMYCGVRLTATEGGYTHSRNEHKEAATWCCWSCYRLLGLKWLIAPSDPEG